MRSSTRSRGAQPMPSAIAFSVLPLRYYPDLPSGEIVNVGVAIVSESADWWDVRLVKAFDAAYLARFRNNQSALKSSLAALDRAIEGATRHRKSSLVPGRREVAGFEELTRIAT